MKQESLSDMEYSCRKKRTKREEFLEIMDEIIPRDKWVSLIVPRYPIPFEGEHTGILTEIGALGEKFDFLMAMCDSFTLWSRRRL